MYLQHHGIKGQQWGVRHGPPYPIDEKKGDITIRQGTKFKRLSVYNESVAKGHAYVTYLNKDVEHYRGFFGARLKAMNRNKDVYSIQLSANKELKAPSKSKRVETFLELYRDDPAIGKELGKYYKSDWHYFTPLPSKFYEWRYSRLDEKGLKKKGYNTFVRSIGGNEYTRNAYFKKLADKGYDFVTDDMDAGRFGKEPSIIFDRQASTTYEGQNVISADEIFKTWKREGTYIKGKK